ncbi:MAG TPA: enoyl-CoA hydratase-related protein [Solirubrobacteraceae bacterium]|nr:enoyl-CoA hydratase-related protein [Solirubrobacteraceae bacterium]
MSRVTVRHDDGLATLRLTRADAGNAIDPQWVADFGEAVAACEGARAVLICADGPAFTVGGDLKHFAGRRDELAEALEEMVPAYHAALGQLAAHPAPVVAAIQGPIAGGGLGLAFCADIVLATPDTRFVCGFSLLGLSGDGGGSWFLPRRVGPLRAAEMMLLNRPVSAEEAVELGLATRVIAADRLAAEADAIARQLAAGPTRSFAHMKRLLRESWAATLDQQLDAETAAMIDCGATADAREGVDAFLARRPPNFTGG